MAENTNVKKVGIFKRFTQFLKDSKNELKKVVWPTKRTVINNTIVVIVVMVLAGIFIWLLDTGMGAIVKFLLGFVK